jgi:hypothetical protein
MRESRTYGSVRGARGNSRPYRDEGVSRADAISRCKSDPGKAEQAAWRRVLREAAAMPNTKRTQLLRGVGDRATKWACCRSGGRAHGRTQYEKCRYARHHRPAGVEKHITRKRIASEAEARIGKARSRSR